MNLEWIASQQARMEALLESWANINSFTENISGLDAMAEMLMTAFGKLGPIKRIPLPAREIIDSNGKIGQQPLGDALYLSMRPTAPFRFFIGGHFDTVYPTHTKAERISPDRMLGQGVADMKGGLVIMLILLEALESSPLADKIGWELLINPDEEIGSPGSRLLFAECATRNHLGLIFEPAFADGKIVSSRKGTATFTIVAHGRAAHAGRDFASGRNAITALAKFLLKAEALTDLEKETTVNVGQIRGGHAVNIVPDLAIGRLNIRVVEANALERVRESLNRFARESDVTLLVHEDSVAPPKPFDAEQEKLFELLQKCDQALQWQPSGGACDGNRLQAAGLRTIDSLGVIGGGLHTPEEYVFLPSLSARAQLVAKFLTKVIDLYNS